MSTKAGDVGLAIPKQRRGSLFPSVLERRRRIDRALFAVVMEAYVLGVSTATSTTWSRPWDWSRGISKSEVSRICAELDVDMSAFRSLSLGYVAFPHVFCDATYVKGRVGGRVVARAMVVATGVTATATVGCRPSTSATLRAGRSGRRSRRDCGPEAWTGCIW